MKIQTLLAFAAVATCLTAVADAQSYGSVDAMAITRNQPSNSVFLRNQTMAGTLVGSETVLGANDLDLDFITAGRVTAGNRYGVLGIEGSYMLTDDWMESAFASDPGGMLASPFTPVGAAVNPMVDHNTSAMIGYSTKMQSAEVHLTQRVYSAYNGEASLLYGAKGVWIDETLDYMTTNAGMSYSEHVSVDNMLIGPQIGVLLEAPFPDGVLDVTFKVAVTNQSVDKTAVLNGVTTLTGSDNGAALVSDIGINGSVFITENLLFKMGYHILSLSDVALATDNLENLAFPPLAASFGKDRGLVYQSLYLGLTLTH